MCAADTCTGIWRGRGCELNPSHLRSEASPTFLIPATDRVGVRCCQQQQGWGTRCPMCIADPGGCELNQNHLRSEAEAHLPTPFLTDQILSSVSLISPPQSRHRTQLQTVSGCGQCRPSALPLLPADPHWGEAGPEHTQSDPWVHLNLAPLQRPEPNRVATPSKHQNQIPAVQVPHALLSRSSWCSKVHLLAVLAPVLGKAHTHNAHTPTSSHQADEPPASQPCLSAEQSPSLADVRRHTARRPVPCP